MKKLIGCLIVMTLLPVAFMVGCDNAPPVAPGPAGSPTNTPVATSTPTKTATVTPTGTLTPSATPTVTSTPAAYTTPQVVVQAPVTLGTAANYVILAYSAITNSGPTSICGGLGISPLASVGGGIVETCGGPRDIANTASGIAKTDLSTAYTNISPAARPGGAILPPGADIGGQTLYPGLYTESTSLSISSADLTLNGNGNPNAIFIFQVAQFLNITSGRQVFLIGGAQAKYVYWQVADYCSLGTTAAMVGNILAYNSVTLNTGATLNGRALASNNLVSLLSNTITKP